MPILQAFFRDDNTKAKISFFSFDPVRRNQQENHETAWNVRAGACSTDTEKFFACPRAHVAYSTRSNTNLTIMSHAFTLTTSATHFVVIPSSLCLTNASVKLLRHEYSFHDVDEIATRFLKWSGFRFILLFILLIMAPE